LTLTDIDGDSVTIKTSKGTSADLAAAVTKTLSGLGEQIQTINLTNSVFEGTTLSITGKRTNNSGDGFVNVGFIDATGIDLGAIKIGGDLGRIVAGDIDSKPGLSSLSVHSLGAMGTSTGAPSLDSVISGSVGKLSVKTNVVDAYFLVETNGEAIGKIGSVTIGRNLDGGDNENFGRIEAAGDIGPVKIGGSVLAGDGQRSGSIDAGGKIASITIGGNLLGGQTVSDSGIIESDSTIGPVKIGGRVEGGNFQNTGSIKALGKIASVSVGALLGGDGIESGQIDAGEIGSITIGGNVAGGFGNDSGQIISGGNVGNVRIVGGIYGGEGERSGTIIAGNSSDETLGAVSVGLDVLGGSGESSGSILAGGSIKSVSIGGSLRGGTADNTGLIEGGRGIGVKVATVGNVTIRGSLIGSPLPDSASDDLVNTGYITGPKLSGVTVFGDIEAGLDESTGGDLINNASIRAEFSIGKILVRGNIIGNEDTRVLITAKESLAGVTATRDVTIGSVTVLGNLSYTDILAGYERDSQDLVSATSAGAINVDAELTILRVGGNWLASNAAAGAKAGTDGLLGTQDDTRTVPGGSGPPVNATMRSVFIGGQVLATADPSDAYGIVAEEIRAMRVGGVVYKLSPQFRNDVENSELNQRFFLSADTRYHEVPTG
jgi:hypothetical protein